MSIEIDKDLVALLEKDADFQKIRKTCECKSNFEYIWFSHDSKGKCYPTFVKKPQKFGKLQFDFNPVGRWGSIEKHGKEKLELEELISIIICGSYENAKIRFSQDIVAKPIKKFEYHPNLKAVIDKYKYYKNKSLIEMPSSEKTLVTPPAFTEEDIKASEQDADGIERLVEGFEGEERDAIAKTRTNQGRFRKILLAYWDNTCAVSGLKEEKLLIASHILPWSKCETKHQKGDPFNGLLLSVIWDSLFDKGLISFDDNGQAILDRLSYETKECLGLKNEPYSISAKKLTNGHKQYLKMHRILHGFSS